MPVKTSYDKECLISEYKNVYTGKNGERTKPIKPQIVFDPNPSPFAKDTTNRDAYIAHKVHVPAQREKQVYIPSSAPLQNMTTVREHYVPHKMETNKSKKPVHNLNREQGKMSNVTSNRMDYTPKKVVKTDAVGDYSSLTVAPGPFEGSTTMRDDYVKYATRPRTSYTPRLSYQQPTVAMDGLTNHKIDYMAWDLPKKHVRKSQSFVPQAGKTGTTTMQCDFTGKHVRRPSPCLPQHANTEKGEFYDSTTFRENYRAWPVCPPVQRVRAVHCPPDQPLESNTCYRDDFTGKTARPVSCKPRMETRSPQGPMASSTTHRDAFVSWNAKPATPALDYHVRATPPPFEGMSTYKDHYLTCAGAPAELLAPPNTYTKSDVPLDSGTTYKRDYIPREMNRCPVPGLPKTPALTKAGHRFYNAQALTASA